LSELKQLPFPKGEEDELSETIEELEKSIRRHDLQLSKLEISRETYEKFKARVISLKHAVKALSITPSLTEDYSAQLHSIKLTLKLKSLLHKHVDRCPTCLSEIDEQNVRKAVSKAESQLPKVERLLEAQELHLAYREAVQELKDQNFDESEYEHLQEQRQKCLKQLKRYRIQLKVHTEYNTVKAKVESLRKPKSVDKPDIDLSYDDCNVAIDLCTSILKHLNAKQKLLKSSKIKEFKTVTAIKAVTVELEIELESIETSLHNVRAKQVVMSNKLEQQNTYKHSVELYATELNTIETELAELTAGCTDKAIYKELVRAYSSKGLKSIVASHLSKLLQQAMNQHRHLLFHEPFEFTWTCSDKGLDITVDRRNKMVSDVRNLSGAESNAFRMLCVLALYSVIPDDRRFNMLVLDEPSAHQDVVFRDLFLTRFLPVLQKCVPSVYIITPNESDYTKGASEWLVVKHKGKSALKCIR
jgi:DNA repair exonuclease SbcCD ATPase subunit